MSGDMWKHYWPVYQHLESELEEISYSISFCDEQLTVHSLRLSDLLLRICAECENASKSIIDMYGLKNAGKDISDLYFPQCGDILVKKFTRLNRADLFIRWHYQTFSNVSRIPFEKWNETPSTNPEWFTAYNTLKHDRIRNAHLGNLSNVLAGLGGLFILNLLLRKEEIDQITVPHEDAPRMQLSFSQFFSPEKFLLYSPFGMYRTFSLNL